MACASEGLPIAMRGFGTKLTWHKTTWRKCLLQQGRAAVAVSLKTGLNSMTPPSVMLCAESRADTLNGYLCVRDKLWCCFLPL